MLPICRAQGPKPYTGRGWVAGNMLTTELLRNMLKQGPSETSADVIDLEVDDANGNVSNPQSVKLRRILACSGDWFRVELALEKGMVPLLKSDGPAGTVRGWANGSCTQQLTTCDFDQAQALVTAGAAAAGMTRLDVMRGAGSVVGNPLFRRQHAVLHQPARTPGP